MLNKILGFGTAIVLSSCIIEGNLSPAVASNLDNRIAESDNSYLIAQGRTHRVRLGDTLGGIANRYGVSFKTLLNYNPKLRSRPNLIYLGETINVGGGGGGSTSTPKPRASGNKYTVRSGDTLGGIAIRHGLSLRTILSYNPQLASRRNSINVGERINVGSAQVIRRSRNTNYTSRRTRTYRKTTPTSTSTPTQTTSTSTPTPTQTTRQSLFNNLPQARRQGSNNIGSKRGPEKACTEAGKNMKAIAPSNGLGFTFDDYPYFFWYFPGIESDSVPIIFSLLGEEKEEINGNTETTTVTIYEKNLNLDKSAIIAFPLPVASKPLEEGKEYQWRIQINCTPKTRMYLEYSIKRKSTDNPELVSLLEAAPVDEHPLIFAESGIWFDALKMIALQLEQAPEDPILTEDWNEVLRQIDFQNLIGEPIEYIEPNNIQ